MIWLGVIGMVALALSGVVIYVVELEPELYERVQAAE